MNIDLVDVAFASERLAFEGQHKNMVKAGSVAIGIDQVLGLLNTSKLHRLRIHGHGMPGVQIMGAGKTDKPPRDQVISYSHKHGLRGGAQLQRLRGHFSKYGLIELHGCNVANGHNGKELLWLISNLLQVSVRAATGYQGTNPMHFYNSVYEIKPGMKKPRVVAVEEQWPPPGAAAMAQ
jgi:hypothetical protein